MRGVEEHHAAGGRPGRPNASDHDHDLDEAADDWPPDRAPSPWRQAWDRLAARWRPWIGWFGAGRLAGGALTVVVAVALGWWLLRPAPPPTESQLPYASVPSSASSASSSTTTGGGPSDTSMATSTTSPVVVVHVAGAVVAPGVAELPTGSRVADGVTAVGGALADADLSAVNLAAVLVDGQQVFVPRVGETAPPVAQPPPPASGGTDTPTGPIDLNVATVDVLDELPGVGPATAMAIVTHRDDHGPFATVDDLEAVPGIGPAKLEAIRDLVTA